MHKSSSSQFGRLLTAAEKRKGEKLGRNVREGGVLDKDMIEDLKRDLLKEVLVESQ